MIATIKYDDDHMEGDDDAIAQASNVFQNAVEMLKMSRNATVNDVCANPNRVIGLETARDVFHIEHGQDFCSEQNITDFVSDYIDGKFQSAVGELLYSAFKLCVHKPTSLTRNYGTSILPSQLDAWLWPTSELLAPAGGQAGCWPAYQPILCRPSKTH
jgi:hypothetical protein